MKKRSAHMERDANLDMKKEPLMKYKTSTTHTKSNTWNASMFRIASICSNRNILVIPSSMKSYKSSNNLNSMENVRND